MIYDAEHFFDGYARRRRLRARDAARRRCAAAPRRSSCATPTAARCRGRSRRSCATWSPTLSASPLGIHTHDDSGCARRQHARRRARRRAATCRARSTATASAAATPTCARSSRTSSSSSACAACRTARLAELSELVALRRRGRQPRARRAPAYVGKQRVRPQGRHARRGHAPQRATATSTSIPTLVGNADARRRQRAVGPRQPAAARPRSSGSTLGDGAEVEALERDQGARGARASLRERRGLGRADDAAPAATDYAAAVRARRLPGARSASAAAASTFAEATVKVRVGERGRCTPPPRATAR